MSPEPPKIKMRQAPFLLALAGALTACTTHKTYEFDALLGHEKDSDGRVFEMVIYPIDRGFPNQYRFCLEPCSNEQKRLDRRGLPYLAGDTTYIMPRVPGEFDGMDGNHPVRVRAAFDAHCFMPNAVCVDLAFYWFREVE